MFLPDSTTEAHPSVPGLSVRRILSSFIRHQSSGLLQRITSGSTNEADGPTTDSPQCSRPLAASCSSLQLQSMHESQKPASLVAYARVNDIQAMYHGVHVPSRNGPATSMSCAFQCALTLIEVISDRRTKRIWRSHDTSYQCMVHERFALLDQPSETLYPAIFGMRR